jgi:PAS domain S-box-containing protein
MFAVINAAVTAIQFLVIVDNPQLWETVMVISFSLLLFVLAFFHSIPHLVKGLLLLFVVYAGVTKQLWMYGLVSTAPISLAIIPLMAFLLVSPLTGWISGIISALLFITITIFNQSERLSALIAFNAVPFESSVWIEIGLSLIGMIVAFLVILDQYYRLILNSEEKYRLLYTAMDQGLALHEIITDEKGKPVDYVFLDINDSYTRLLGLTREMVIGKRIKEVMPEVEQYWIDFFGKVALTGESNYYENYLEATGKYYSTYSYSPKKNQFAVLVNDITDRKLAEKAIDEEKERLAVTLRSIGDGVITTDIQGNVVLINRVAENLTGWKQNEAQGKQLNEIFNIISQKTGEKLENPVEKVLSSGQVIELENQTLLVSRDGTERIIADSGAPIKDRESKNIGVVIVFRDMTEKLKLLDSMQRIDKMDSLGILAGGIAHDFNNLLGGIFGYIDMAKECTSDDELVNQYLDKALGVFDRVKDLTQQLLTFSKGGAPKRKVGHLGKLVKENASFVLSGKNISCEYQISEDLWLADYDANQIGQVIDNLVINAQQAMPMGGTIFISVNNISLSDGNFIKISIKDRGVGISQDMVKRIFDPFFTTKQKGNGLGLATCYSIVQKHDGTIDVESIPGQGTTFHVYLPANHEETLEYAPQAQIQHKGQGTILVMEDEDFLREIISQMLIDMGYTPVEAVNGNEALRIFAEAKMQGNTIKGALFDLTVPGGMGGKEAISKLRIDFPDIPVFAASGFSEDPVMARPTEFGFTDSIRKPFRKEELAELLNRHIGKPEK